MPPLFHFRIKLIFLKLYLLRVEGQTGWRDRYSQVTTRLLVFVFLIDINHIRICDINSFSDVAESDVNIIYISSIEKETKRKREREIERERIVYNIYSRLSMWCRMYFYLLFFSTIRIVYRMNDRIIRVWFSNGTEDTFSFVYGEIHTSIDIHRPATIIGFRALHSL